MKEGCNKHMGGMNTAKPKAHEKGIDPRQFARNNLAKGGVNHRMTTKVKK